MALKHIESPPGEQKLQVPDGLRDRNVDANRVLKGEPRPQASLTRKKRRKMTMMMMIQTVAEVVATRLECTLC